MNKTAYFIIGGLAATAVLISAAYTNNDEAVATVGETAISKEELYTEMVRTSGEESLQLLITNEIIRQEAENEQIDVTEEEIEAEKAEYAEGYGSQEAFEEALAAGGMTTEEMEAEIERFLQIEKLIGADIDISEEDIQAYYEENEASFAQEEEIEASHILVDTEELADEVAEKLEEGEEFAALAEEYSTDISNAANGGELGAFAKGAMVPAFEEAAFALDVNEISEPVETEFGFHIIQLTGKTEAQDATLEDNEAEIQKVLFDEAFSMQYPLWLEEKTASYEISNKLSEGEL